VAPKKIRTRENPQSPLATPVSDLEKIINQGKDLQGASSSKSSGIYGKPPDLVFQRPVTISESSHTPEVESPKTMKEEIPPFEYILVSPDLKEESLESYEFPLLVEIVKEVRIEDLEGEKVTYGVEWEFPFLYSPHVDLPKFSEVEKEESSSLTQASTQLSKSGSVLVKSKPSSSNFHSHINPPSIKPSPPPVIIPSIVKSQVFSLSKVTPHKS
jgi:hypothetical protein